ncbi:hypothetical protein E4T47_05836 [Aureobasidium subglaciale]|nr:hypothetical protein E4T43_05325 [Aureobasidium subglaciale]KAI5270851.1 hypothetical protein E4T47_05836 [Aureobasidium subglaciale]
MSDHEEKLAGSSSSPMSSVAMQSPITEHIDNGNNEITAVSRTPPQSANKRSRGRPRKYHTDAEREEAKRRYRENHKTKAASGGGVSGGAIPGNHTAFVPAQPVPRQQDVDDLWEAVRGLQAEVAGLKMQLAQRDAAAAAALPPQKRRKVGRSNVAGQATEPANPSSTTRYLLCTCQLYSSLPTYTKIAKFLIKFASEASWPLAAGMLHLLLV